MLPRLLTRTATLLFILTGSAASQTTFATVTGTITDSTGSVVPGATVDATHTATNYQHSAVSNEAGVYTLSQLREGDYIVRVRLAGFKAAVVNDLQLTARDVRRLDFALQVGAVEESVQVVAASAGLIETDTARISDTKDAELLQRLPLNTRSTLGLLNQTAGVYERTGTTGSATIRYGGSRTNQENAAIDGITFLAMDGTAIHPMAEYMESVSELRVDLGNNTAEFGAVGQMTLISKSGSNQVPQASIYGQATINGAGSFIYRIRVQDLGEPGAGHDTYGILLSNGYSSGEQVLEGGNVQIQRQ